MKHISALLIAILLSTSLFAQGISAPVPTFNILTYTDHTDGSLETAVNTTGTPLQRVNSCKIPTKPCSTGFSSKGFLKDKTFSFIGPAIEFSIAPAANYTITAKSITADTRRSGTG